MADESTHTSPVDNKRGLRELLSLVVPIFTLLFIPCLVGFFERIYLSRYSLEALVGSVQAINILQLFQYPLINFANMTQTFIGKHLGARQSSKVGCCVWQMVWIALLSMVFIAPIGMFVGPLFLKGIAGESFAMTYFNTLLGVNFLFPLGAALSSFYLAQEQHHFIIKVTLIAYGIALLLHLILIPGIPHILHPLGILGASISTALGRFLFCAILFIYFLRQPSIQQYQTYRWKIDLSQIWHYLRICTPRMVGRVCILLLWALTSRFMSIKGGDYALVLSIGGTLIFFCYFFADSLIQALTLIFSRQLGAQQYEEMWRSWRTGLQLVIIVSGILSIPFLIFPDLILSFFFVEIPTGPLREYLHKTLYWVWAWVVISNLAGLFLPFLLARRDTLFYMLVASLTLITSCLPVYYFIYQRNLSPDKFWLILTIEQCTLLFFYSCRALWLQRGLVKPISES